MEKLKINFDHKQAGVPGSGRTTAVKDFLEEMAKGKPVPPDWCYVENFRAVEKDREELLARLNERAQEKGFVLQGTPIGVLIMPSRGSTICKTKPI